MGFHGVYVELAMGSGRKRRAFDEGSLALSYHMCDSNRHQHYMAASSPLELAEHGRELESAPSAENSASDAAADQKATPPSGSIMQASERGRRGPFACISPTATCVRPPPEESLGVMPGGVPVSSHLVYTRPGHDTRHDTRTATVRSLMLRSPQALTLERAVDAADATMDLGSVTLLEICQRAHGSRIACCLPRGEFIFVTKDTPQFFHSTLSAAGLFGKSLFDFLVPYDVEKLQDYMRAHTHGDGTLISRNVSNKLTMMVRLVGSGQMLWVRMKTVPLSLRLLRCIDAVTVLAPLQHHFTDSSSFVISEDELLSIAAPMTDPPPPSLCNSTSEASSPPTHARCGNRVIHSLEVHTHYERPLELKPFDECFMSTSPVSPTGLLGSVDDGSLSNLAFEADWE